MTAMAIAQPIIGAVTGHQANQAADRAANRQNDFQREMSNTAHQRQVKDLRAAGLNPILSAMGSGASTPQGAQPNITSLGEGISSGANTGIAMKQMQADLKLKEATTHNTNDSSRKVVQEAQLTGLQTREQIEKNKQAVMHTEMLKQTIPAMIREARAKGDWAQVNQLMGIIKTGTSSAADAAGLLSPIKFSFPKGK